MGPFYISKELVASLSDEQLRVLLDRLLNAEALTRGISPDSVVLGGNQTASDGGVDASISWTGRPAPGEWLPRRLIYFQSKAAAMAPAKLKTEMRPHGLARPIFSELTKARGAYIVFSTDDPSKSGYDSRIAAMRSAISDVHKHERIHLDFYGADKIARWANQHAGVAAWLLEQTGRPLGGWRPYGSWSAPDAEGQPYVLDLGNRARIAGTSCDIKAAIASMRRTLANPGGTVRLVGLSGMGKTRLAEALFDQRLDPPSALLTARAIYGDVGLDLGVSAARMVEQLSASGVPAVIVVDNCTARTHGQLAEIIARGISRASLLTIDYDVGGENTPGLEVVLTANSESVLDAVLAQRAPMLSEAERRHLAEFSGGNARIALKLAEAGGAGVDLSKLRDNELLDRLFQTGRVERDHAVRLCAETASLVYAFYVTDGDGHGPEHSVLASLAAVDPDAFYRNISGLLEWGVVQKRGPQRAVMPPPLANMLAAPLLRRSDPSTLLQRFLDGPERLLASFARRLGHLHDEPAAVALAERLLAADGLLGQPEALNDTLRQGFVKAAPAAPESALAAIERSLAGSGRQALTAAADLARRDFTQLLVLIAHDAALFNRAVQALLAFALSDGDSREELKAKDHLLERFWPILSFTLADQETRLASIDDLLRDEDDRIRALGIEALDHMLDAGHFSSSLNLEFGSRSRLTEWRPYNGAGYSAWFEAAYERLIRIAAENGPHASRARDIIAGHFREHLDAGFRELALQTMQAVAGNSYWEAGWRSVNDALHFESRRPGSADLGPIQDLERMLRPVSLDDLFETFVLGEPWRHWHPAGREGRPLRSVGLLARAVGRAVARTGEGSWEYLERAGRGEGHNSAWQFAAGLARAFPDPEVLWQAARTQMAALEPRQYNPAIFGGILEGAKAHHGDWVDAKLDQIVADPGLSDHLVLLHSSVPLNPAAIERFSQALATGRVAPNRFSQLMMGGVTKSVPGPVLARFLEQLFSRGEGVLPAIEVLHMRIYGDRSDKVPIDNALIALGRRILSDPRTYTEEVAREDHGLTEVATLTLEGETGAATARAVCRAMRDSEGSNRHSYRDFDELCALVMKKHPRVVLDEIVELSDNEYLIGRFFGGWSRNDEDFDPEALKLDQPLIMNWAKENPVARAVKLAQFVPYIQKDRETATLRWSTIALDLVAVAADPVSVLRTFEQRFFTGGGSGPFELRFIRRRPLVVALLDHPDSRIRTWAAAARRNLEDSIRRWGKIDADRDSRFE